MLHGRARNQAIKDIVFTQMTKLSPEWRSNIRVQLGKGTARSWATIITARRLDDGERAEIVGKLIAKQLIGQYPDDMSSDLWPCVHFDVSRPEVK